MKKIINYILNWTINRMKEGLFYADKYQLMIIILIMLTLTSCVYEKNEAKCELKIVADKTKERNRYLIAFKDLTSFYVKFGIYANVQKNDTLYYIDNSYLSIEPCK